MIPTQSPHKTQSKQPEESPIAKHVYPLAPSHCPAAGHGVGGQRSTDREEKDAPDILDEESSSEVTVKEGHDVTLVCRARGSPKPVISWKREDGGRIDLNNGINLRVTNSEVLHIPSVSRLHMGAYLCIASNEVPPSVSKRIMLNVQFQPVLWIPNQLVGVALGMSVTLECHTEAFPRSINYWTDDKGKMILSSGRFDTVVTENSYRAYMRLKIKNVQPEDYMSYGCYAKNSLGETNGSIKVYEIPRELMVNPPAPEPTQPDEDQVKLERENQTKNLRPKDPENKTRPDRRGQGHRSGISENHPLHNTPPTSSSPPRPRPGHALNASLVSGLLAAWLLHALAAARQRV
nr:MAM domain-containing glycosylphosphatidylinositol anchor protein 1-like [Penaeus vannamei]